MLGTLESFTINRTRKSSSSKQWIDIRLWLVHPVVVARRVGKVKNIVTHGTGLDPILHTTLLPINGCSNIMPDISALVSTCACGQCHGIHIGTTTPSTHQPDTVGTGHQRNLHLVCTIPRCPTTSGKE